MNSPKITHGGSQNPPKTQEPTKHLIGFAEWLGSKERKVNKSFVSRGFSHCELRGLPKRTFKPKWRLCEKFSETIVLKKEHLLYKLCHLSRTIQTRSLYTRLFETAMLQKKIFYRDFLKFAIGHMPKIQLLDWFKIPWVSDYLEYNSHNEFASEQFCFRNSVLIEYYHFMSYALSMTQECFLEMSKKQKIEKCFGREVVLAKKLLHMFKVYFPVRQDQVDKEKDCEHYAYILLGLQAYLEGVELEAIGEDIIKCVRDKDEARLHRILKACKKYGKTEIVHSAGNYKYAILKFLGGKGHVDALKQLKPYFFTDKGLREPYLSIFFSTIEAAVRNEQKEVIQLLLKWAEVDKRAYEIILAEKSTAESKTQKHLERKRNNSYERKSNQE